MRKRAFGEALAAIEHYMGDEHRETYTDAISGQTKRELRAAAKVLRKCAKAYIAWPEQGERYPTMGYNEDLANAILEAQNIEGRK